MKFRKASCQKSALAGRRLRRFPVTRAATAAAAAAGLGAGAQAKPAQLFPQRLAGDAERFCRVRHVAVVAIEGAGEKLAFAGHQVIGQGGRCIRKLDILYGRGAKESFGVKQRLGTQDARAFDSVLEFPDVARPGIGNQCLLGAWIDAPRGTG